MSSQFTSESLSFLLLPVLLSLVCSNDLHRGPVRPVSRKKVERDGGSGTEKERVSFGLEVQGW